MVHRKHLRAIITDFKISNIKLYERCKEQPISLSFIIINKLKIFGHILRLPEQTPARQSMVYYFETPEKSKKFRGTPRTTLPTSINDDLKNAAKRDQSISIKPLTSIADLNSLQKLAQDRKSGTVLSTSFASLKTNKILFLEIERHGRRRRRHNRGSLHHKLCIL